ncbi:GNAT family N-acetyltransferase [Salirhabdus sp. Marseille-P4669]|uniref:GNAT family N-acetyltransferase n=1 Tax=Salirhabdus sp. Marseille-P4669 TaxID=2042310 RepID=UPI000C7972DC|nr:GNAT family N-acetyltransferase [Salirhabdus sp. Marseille-P4669]
MQEIKKGQGRFYVGESEDNLKAEITFVESKNNVLTVDHTFVSEELRGSGMAGKLVDKMVNFAREEGKKIEPICEYAKKKIEKTPEYQDVLV